jgi:ribosomal protein S18 acetylase RimI-like enzyme
MDPPVAPVPVTLSDLSEEERRLAVPVILESFTGIYRWHAKRTLREIGRVRAARIGGEVVGVALLERLNEEVGYVYYLMVARARRGTGLGARLLDDALDGFRREGISVVYAATEEDNGPMVRLLERRKFRPVDRKETSYREGGLGAWGLLSRMRVVGGETLYGLRFPRTPGSAPRET